MKLNLRFLSIILILGTTLISCNQNNEESDIVAYRVTEKDLIPEGITYSKTTNYFYISSIKKKKIVQIDAETGDFKDFNSSDLHNTRYLGMFADDTRNNLWACGNISNDSTSSSTVSKFNLKTGALIKSYRYNDTADCIYNDLVLDKSGNVYFTNTNAQTIYKIDKETDSVSIFFDGPEIIYPNGITISPDNKYLYIASNDLGIRILDIENIEIKGEASAKDISFGIDGLKYYKNSLIGLQNEVKKRSDRKISRYFLDDTGTKITETKIIDQDNSYFDIPTTFVIFSDIVYLIANSQMGNIDFSNYEIRDTSALDDVLILKYKLQ